MAFSGTKGTGRNRKGKANIFIQGSTIGRSVGVIQNTLLQGGGTKSYKAKRKKILSGKGEAGRTKLVSPALVETKKDSPTVCHSFFECDVQAK